MTLIWSSLLLKSVIRRIQNSVLMLRIESIFWTYRMTGQLTPLLLITLFNKIDDQIDHDDIYFVKECIGNIVDFKNLNRILDLSKTI